MALYTPFFEKAAANIGNAVGAQKVGKLAQNAYLGDEKALGNLMKYDPGLAQQIKTQRMQEDQVKLSTQATQQQMKQSAQQWAVQNKDMLDKVMAGAAKFQTFPEAQQYIASQVDALKQSGVEIPAEFNAETFTPEHFQQVKQAYTQPAEDFTLAAGAERRAADGSLIAKNEPEKSTTASTDIGKAKQDLDNGFITPEQFNKIAARSEVPKDAPDVYKDAAELRKEFSGIQTVKDFAQQATAYGRVQAAATDPSAAGDMALIFGYMKLLDPGSTVREGEYATAAAAGSVPERVRALYNKASEGETLAAGMRDDFTNRATRLYKNAEEQYGKVYDQYKGIAERRELPIEDTLVDYRYFARPENATDANQSDSALTAEEQTELQALRAQYGR